MTQVILYTTENNGVALCKPTGLIPIEEVLIRDCPPGAFIIDDSLLPMNEYDFFDAWEWDGSIKINMTKAKDFYLRMINQIAAQQASQRALNTNIGLPNEETDQQFVARLNTARAAIQAANTTADLRAIRI